MTKKLVFTGIVLVASLLLVETILRAYLILRWQTPLAEYQRFGYDRVPFLGFEMMPGLRDAKLASIETIASTNSRGFRGEREFGPKAPGERRVAILGESSVFGFGASNDDTTITAFLEKELATRSQPPHTAFTVINAGNVAYVSYQVLARLQLRLLDLKPDTIAVYTGWNDLWFSSYDDPFVPNVFKGANGYFEMDSWQSLIESFNDENPPRLAPRGFAITMFAKRAYRRFRPDRAEAESSATVLSAAGDAIAKDSRFPHSPERRANVLRQLRNNLLSIGGVAHAHGIRCIFITLFSETDLYSEDRAGINSVIREVARETNSVLIDADAIVRDGNRIGLNHEGDRYHLTDEGNHFLARLLADTLLASGESVQGRDDGAGALKVE